MSASSVPPPQDSNAGLIEILNGSIQRLEELTGEVDAVAESDAEADIVKSYQLQANCYLSKPVQLDEFENLVKSITDFWLVKSKLPLQAQGDDALSLTRVVLRLIQPIRVRR